MSGAIGAGGVHQAGVQGDQSGAAHLDQLKLVARMRDYRRQYFEARKKHMYDAASKLLAHAKDYEARVDRMVKDALGEEKKVQGEMF